MKFTRVFLTATVMLFASLTQSVDAREFGGTNCGAWFPATSQICSGVSFRQENICDRQRNAVGTKNCCRDTSWSPSTGSQCKGARFTQRSNCGNTRAATGTYVPNNWKAATSSVCKGVRFTQKNSCNASRAAVGTKNCCTVSSWTPSAGSRCKGASFTQTSNCGTKRTAVGTSVPNNWAPAVSTRCKGTRFTQKNSCGASRTVTGTSVPNNWAPAVSTVCKGKAFTQKNSCNASRTATGTKAVTDYSPAPATVCKGKTFTQRNSCGDSRSSTGTKSVTDYSPAPSTVCEGKPFTQSNSCGGSKQAVGTKTGGSCCTDTSWTPAANAGSICQGESVVQTSNCGRKRTINGTVAVDSYSPAASSVCRGLSFVQTNLCGKKRTITGTKVFGPECALDEGTITSKLIARLSATEPVKVYSQPLSDSRYPGEQFPVELDGSNLANVAHPVFLRTGNEFTSFLSVKATNSFNNAPQPNDKVTFCLRTEKAPVVGTWTDDSTRTSACGSHTVNQSRTCTFNTRGNQYPLCDECEGVTTSQTVNYTNTQSGGTWQPDRSTVCRGVAMTQNLVGGTCTESRNTTGTGEPNDWVPARNTVCTGVSFVQRNSCNQTRNNTGTLAAGPWSPSNAGVCANRNVNQSNSCGGTRTVPGAVAIQWVPNANTQCPGTSVRQTSCAGSRNVNGTKTTGCGGTGGGTGTTCPTWPYPATTIALSPSSYSAPGFSYIGHTPPVGTGQNAAARFNYANACGNTGQTSFICNNTTIGQYGCRAGDR